MTVFCAEENRKFMFHLYCYVGKAAFLFGCSAAVNSNSFSVFSFEVKLPKSFGARPRYWRTRMYVSTIHALKLMIL